MNNQIVSSMSQDYKSEIRNPKSAIRNSKFKIQSGCLTGNVIIKVVPSPSILFTVITPL
jgi:hypothetical protein